MDKLSKPSSVVLAILWVVLMYGSALAAEKPRIVVMTDIGGDPDDIQSMVRFLLYACDFEVEGLCTGFGHGHYKKTRPELIRSVVEAYGKVLPNLRKHRPDYPSEKRLINLIKVRGKPVKVPVETEGVLEITQTSVLSRRRLRYSRRLS